MLGKRSLKRAIKYSVILHLALISLFIFSFSQKEPSDLEGISVTISELPGDGGQEMSGESLVSEEVKQEPSEPAKPEKKPEVTKPEVQEALPVDKKTSKVAETNPKAEAEKKIENIDAKKKSGDANDAEYKKLLKDVQSGDKTDANTANPTNNPGGNSGAGGQERTPTRYRVMLKSQLGKCWKRVVGQEEGNLTISFTINYTIDGEVENYVAVPKPADMDQASYDKAVEKGEKAIKLCSPLKNMPKEEYKFWKVLIFKFDRSYIGNEI